MTKDGGPAFPSSRRYVADAAGNKGTFYENITEGGMSLRDYFAGQVLAGVMVGNIAPLNDLLKDQDRLAHRIYGLADAMLAEREKGND